MLSHDATGVLAGAVLAAFSLALAAWALWAHRRTDYTPLQAAFYLYGTMMTRVVWRTWISGPLPVVAQRGAVIVCNHTGGMDPAFLSQATNRQIHFMMAREYYESLSIGWFCRIMCCIPVNRAGIDTASTKQAIREARAGHLIGLFPEGRINTTDKLLLPGRPGAALIALKAGVPVIPCYLRGAPQTKTVYGGLFKSARAALIVGDPIDVTAYKDGRDGVLEELTRRFLSEIARLSGAADFVPELAGRRWKPD